MQKIMNALVRMQTHFSAITASEKPLEAGQVGELRRSFTYVENNLGRLWQVGGELRLFDNAKRHGSSEPVNETEKNELTNLIDGHEVLFGRAQTRAEHKTHSDSNNQNWLSVLNTLTNYGNYLRKERSKLGI